MDDAEFWTLRDAPLHLYGPADWDRYYPAMAAWLDSCEARIRALAVERLAMAVFRAEPNADSDAEADAPRRLRWLLATLVDAHARQGDILPVFLDQLRWHGDPAPFRDILLPWLAGLQARPLPGVRSDRLEGTAVLIGRPDPDRCTALLDHASDYVRSCAAYAHGAAGFGQEDAFDAALLDDLTAREIARPGIAGSFWSGWSVTDHRALAFDPLAWMLDIIERRRGAEPADMAFNGIDFQVHELADHAPDAVRRLVAAGRPDLGLMAATESRRPVAGMAPLLRAFGTSDDRAAAEAAQDHLALHYGEVHPGADPARLRSMPQWRPGLDALTLRRPEPRRGRIVLFASGAGLDDAAAEAALDAALPLDARGERVAHPLAPHGSGPDAVVIGDEDHLAFASGARAILRRDPDTRLRTRIEILGGPDLDI